MLPNIKKILYATGMGAGAPHVFRYALALAKQHDADIIVDQAVFPKTGCNGPEQGWRCRQVSHPDAIFEAIQGCFEALPAGMIRCISLDVLQPFRERLPKRAGKFLVGQVTAQRFFDHAQKFILGKPPSA